MRASTKLHPDVVGRFAPSPSGRMHAGNLFAALVTWLIARSQEGRIVLRIEDLDTERSKPSFIDALQRDFERMGLTWDEGPYFQHDRTEAYRAVFDNLKNRGLVYPCFCTRADLRTISAPHRGEKQVYPGTCKNLSPLQRQKYACIRPPAFRLRVSEETISFEDQIQGTFTQNLVRDCGDFLLRRFDGAFTYQLAVVVDDAAQGVTSVVRGVDLLCSTPQQMHLQNLLGFDHPHYAHVPLFVSGFHRRLSKRDKDASFDALIERFKTPEGVLGYIAGKSGLASNCDPIKLSELLSGFDQARLAQVLSDPIEILWD